MRGVILAGGLGTRLLPLTKVINKHLLPIYDRPMIYHSLQNMVDSGIEEVAIVCGTSVGSFMQALGNGEEFGLKLLHYAYQPEPKGIADALRLTRSFVDNDNVCLMLGDNILEHNFEQEVLDFERRGEQARVFLSQVEHPQHYGIAELQDDKIIGIVEKPAEPKSNWAVIGVYMYDQSVWDVIDGLTPSARNELEITDLNNHYLKNNSLSSSKIEGWWMDCGESFDGYLDSCNKMRSLR